jgi:hypothetical protein
MAPANFEITVVNDTDVQGFQLCVFWTSETNEKMAGK